MQYLFDLNALLVAISIAYVTVMWASVWICKYPVPIWRLAWIFVFAFALQLFIYIVFSFILIDIQVRAYMVRTSIIVICLSQAIPLTIVYKACKNGLRSP